MGKKRRLTTEDFIKKAIAIHGNKYDYSLVNYINSSTKVEIICPFHGNFWQIPENHLAKDIRGCFKCGREKTNIALKARSYSSAEFINKARQVHGDIFDYTKTYFKNNKTTIIIICKIHGEFEQAPAKHLAGQGCKLCHYDFLSIKLIKDLNRFIEQANIIHKNKYNYLLSKYNGDTVKVEILCPLHGAFYQTPNAHLRGQGCPKCGFNISYMEQKWLDSLNIPLDFRNKTIKINNRRIKVDAFDPNTKTIYEFNGDYWHGNPKVYDQNAINVKTKTSFGELYKKTIEREKLILQAGYNLIVKWQSD